LFSLLNRPSRIVWVSAPAGAGKSSLGSSWGEARQLRVAWYQVDAGDADPATLFHYLGLAAKAAAGAQRVELPHLTPEYLPRLDVFVRRFYEGFFACLSRRPSSCSTIATKYHRNRSFTPLLTVHCMPCAGSTGRLPEPRRTAARARALARGRWFPKCGMGRSQIH
jgi:hypothetical protein